jgi:frataxin
MQRRLNIPVSILNISFCREDHSLAENQFHKLADSTLDTIFDTIEQYIDAIDLDNDDTDIEYSQGVLSVKLGGGLGTYVINKQTPNRQIWMSSPVSGPVRYDYYKGNWVYSRDGHKLHERLEKELEQLTGVAINLNPCSNCGKMNACVDGNYCQK